MNRWLSLPNHSVLRVYLTQLAKSYQICGRQFGPTGIFKGVKSNRRHEVFRKTRRHGMFESIRRSLEFHAMPNYFSEVLMETDKTSAIKVLANNFPSLNEAQRKTVVTDLNKFMKTKTYINMSNPDKDYALRLIGDLYLFRKKSHFYYS